jgi:hypothetical protein
MPWALLAITAVQIGFAIHQQKELRKAAADAEQTNQRNQLANQSRLTEETQRRRRQNQGVGTGTGTLLTGNNASFVGGTLSDMTGTQSIFRG